MSALTFPYLLGERITQQGIVTPHSASGVSQISSQANQIPLNVGSTGQTSDQPTSVLPTDFSSSLSSITLHDDVIPVERPLFAESPVQPYHIHPPGPPSSSPTRTYSDIYPQIAGVLDANIAMSSGARRTRDTRRDMAHPIPMEISRHENESVPSNTDIDEYTPVPGGQLDGQSGPLR